MRRYVRHASRIVSFSDISSRYQFISCIVDMINNKTNQVAVQEAAHSFCQQELQPNILLSNRHEITFNHDDMQKMGSMGFLGSTIPEYYGGAGLNYVSYGLIATEVERVDSSYRSAMSVQSSLVMHPIYAFGNEELKKKYLPELAKGKLVGCFGLTVRKRTV